MVRHEFLGSYRRQRATYSDGTSVTADFDDCIYGRKYIKKRTGYKSCSQRGLQKTQPLF
nr:MAG TPA: Alpha-N-acetylgalactosaminidase [Caudoviricetes sp.]